jgi:hypothetical protein
MAAVAVIAAAHSPTFAASARGGLGRDKRGGADGGESGRSENRLADHGSFSLFYGDVLAHPGRQSGERSARFNGAAIKTPSNHRAYRHARMRAEARLLPSLERRLAALRHARYKPPQLQLPRLLP